MKKNILKIFAISIFLSTNSCTYTNSDIPIVKITKQAEADNLQLLNSLTIEHLIPIRNDSVILAKFDKIEVHDSLIYIMDRQQALLLVTNMNGNTLLIVDKKGEAPNEYLSLDDFAVDKDGNILIYDTDTEKIVFYTAQGEFIRKIDVCSGTGFKLLENNQIAIYRNILSDKIISLYNVNGNLLKEYTCNTPIPPMLISNGGEIFEKEGEVFFTNPFDYTIYTLTEEEYKPILQFDFGSRNLPDHIKEEKNKRDLTIKMLEFKGVLFLSNLSFFQNTLIATNNLGELIFYDIVQKQPYVFNKLSLPLSVLLGNTAIYVDKNGAVVTSITPDDITNTLLPLVDEYLNEYPFLQILKQDINKYLDNEWIVLGKML